MSKETKEGKNNHNKNGANKNLRKQRLKRLFLILSIIFVVFAAVTAITTYAAVKYYMADLPPFDPTELEPAQTSFMYDKDGELVTPLMGAENRIIVPLDQMSPDLVDAFIAIEDDRFYDHPGFDARGMFRAFIYNLTNQSGKMQGGSTITQQLVKNTFLTPERTIKRKLQELYLSYQLERIYSKEEILEFYLNRIFFDFNAHGVEAAAQTYFGKSANDVTLGEAAMLAGIPNLPGKYSPYRDFEEAKKRQEIILTRMAEINAITQAEAEAAKAEEIVLSGIPERSYPHPWFVDHVILDEAPEKLATLPEFADLTIAEIKTKLYTSGLHIYTTLDQRIQQDVVNILDNPKYYRKSFRVEETKPIQPQTAVVVADPTTGHVAALVGGRLYETEINVFNRSTKGRMQAGSVLKPIIAYGPAFNEGLASPGTVLDDAPKVFKGNYFPNNYDMSFRGLVTVRNAIANSYNIPAIRLLDQLGVEKGKEYAKRMGLTSLTNDHGLSMVVGGLNEGVSVWDTTQAFSVLANEGIRTDLTTITKIVDSDGNVLYEQEPNKEEILSPQAAWLTTSALIDTVRIGTASALRIGRTVAVKTGTSEYAHDAWMAAYTPQYVTVFWMGQDSWPKPKAEGDYRSFEVTPRFMNPILKAVHKDLKKVEFKRPDGLRKVTICSKSGLRPGEFCPDEHIVTDWFTSSTIPKGTCEMHVELEVCSISGLWPTEFCPQELLETKAFLNRPEYIKTDGRWPGRSGRTPRDAELMPPKEDELCDKHTSRPEDVKNLKAKQVSDNGNVELSWKAVNGASGYLIARKGPGEGAFVSLTSSPVTATTFTDQGLAPGAYSYQLTAISAEGVKSSTTTTTIKVEPPPPPPPPPVEEEPPVEPPPGQEEPPPDDDDDDDGKGNGNGKGN
ncbi:MAG TPA: PBP1A family penicillin-binding protein [Oscillospiraceae bacterium]|nr:PBP1A family penicillin-binding protein [Oscillospiraceae bacterium]